MGRGRRGPTDQSLKMTNKYSHSRCTYLVVGQAEGCEAGAIYYLPEQMMAEIKRMNPRDVARALLSDDVKASDN